MLLLKYETNKKRANIAVSLNGDKIHVHWKIVCEPEFESMQVEGTKEFWGHEVLKILFFKNQTFITMFKNNSIHLWVLKKMHALLFWKIDMFHVLFEYSNYQNRIW